MRDHQNHPTPPEPDDFSEPTREQMRAIDFLGSRYGVVAVGNPAPAGTETLGLGMRPGCRKLTAMRDDIEVVRWVVNPDGQVIGGWDPHHDLDDFKKSLTHES